MGKAYNLSIDTTYISNTTKSTPRNLLPAESLYSLIIVCYMSIFTITAGVCMIYKRVSAYTRMHMKYSYKQL